MKVQDYGLEILGICLVIDNAMDQSEFSIVGKYMSSRGITGFDVKSWAGNLLPLSYDEKVSRLIDAAAELKLEPVERKREIIELSYSIIAADGKITLEESEIFSILSQLWSMDVTRLYTRGKTAGRSGR